MPTCQNCGKEWSWKQTCKKSFTLDTGMKCPHCHEKQYLTTKSRKRSSFSTFLIPFIFLLSLVLNLSTLATLFTIIGAGLLLLGFHPFFIELSNKEEPLW
ncbi:TIGR04104 family putative zinc finger protein [Paucisalibacillus sp. EB02]|uniref:TIGR04104 family putative zinc finger protein n=1 Tax=Paucisalibacillus sp. EB02 TaxID=1347087 RepID=UPI0004BBC26F|nr:TIGR04104 family putative zinc finger protein [Paucisalibacillus sp. EB02]